MRTILKVSWLISSRQEGGWPSSLCNQELLEASPQRLPSWFSVVFEMPAEGCNCEQGIAKSRVDGEKMAPLKDTKHVDLGGSQ
jgi:hypothetical protein